MLLSEPRLIFARRSDHIGLALGLEISLDEFVLHSIPFHISLGLLLDYWSEDFLVWSVALLDENLSVAFLRLNWRG